MTKSRARPDHSRWVEPIVLLHDFDKQSVWEADDSVAVDPRHCFGGTKALMIASSVAWTVASK